MQILFLLSFASLSLVPDNATSPPDCEAAMQAIHSVKACSSAPSGIALASTQQRADQLGTFGRLAEERFESYFGKLPPRYAILEFDQLDDVTARQKSLNAVGFRRTLPWFSREAYAASQNASIRQGIEQDVKSASRSPVQTEAAVQAAISAKDEDLTDFAMTRSESGVVPHELGHGWYVEAFWPGFSLDGRGHYGGPGPDWLDETAAILMEDANYTQSRRDVFVAVYRGKSTGIFAGYPAAKLIDLKRYLSMEHPGNAIGQQWKAEANKTGKPIIKVLSAEEKRTMQAFAADAALFYSQGRVFADYLIDRSGDPSVFGKIGVAFGRGETMDQWLDQEGAVNGLPTSVRQLDKDWRAWLIARFGPLETK